MPAAPRTQRSTVLTWALVLLVDLIAFLPRLAFPNRAAGTILLHPANRTGVPGLGYELGLLVALLALTAGTRAARPLRTLAVVMFAAFLVFSAYHEAYLAFFYIDPAVVDDWRLLVNLGHFIRHAPWRLLLAGAAGVLGLALAIVLVWRAFARLQEWAQQVRWRRRLAAAAGFAIVGALAITWAPRNPLVQPLTDGIAVNVSASRASLANRRALFAAPPDLRYQPFAALPLARRPNVYLMMFEAYGQILATCSEPSYRDLMGRIETRLAASGFHARSGYSIAPIYGGRSWLSIGTLQTGIRIDNQPAYHLLERSAARLPTLTTFFKSHGYHTMMLQPWDSPRFGLPAEDIFGRDRAVIRSDLPYRGGLYGVAGVPDQYSLGFFEAHFLSSAPEPRFMSYMATSTHYDWWSVPPLLRDWRQLDGVFAADQVVPWAPLTGAPASDDPAFVRYLEDVAYEWRVLADFIEARRHEDALIIIVGDHQPLLHCGDGKESFESPIHLIARDQALLDRFADAGLDAGWYPVPGAHAPLKHEGLFSLLVAKLTGDPSRYYPSGISATGLRQ